MKPVMTSTGPIDPASMGVTLMHEHLLLNLTSEYRATGLLNNQPAITEEVGAFKRAGGSTIVELTPAELTIGGSPDPHGYVTGTPDNDFGWASRTPSSMRAINEISEATGINVVLGTGHYRDPYLNSGWVDTHTVNQIADSLVSDLTVGISGTTIKAGIIGEIGADKWYISSREERSFRAAARAQRETGAALTTHAARWPVGIPQLDLLEEESVNLTRVIIGHCNSVAIPKYHREIAERGAYVQFDLIRNESTHQNATDVGYVQELIAAGFTDRILLSQDVCTTSQLKTNGGCGYVFVISEFTELLKAAGVSDNDIDTILIDNPRRALTGE